MNDAFRDLLLSIADDKLILGHRNSDWTGLGPILEEDIAFSALAQDDIAHALALYEVIAARTDTTADASADKTHATLKGTSERKDSEAQEPIVSLSSPKRGKRRANVRLGPAVLHAYVRTHVSTHVWTPCL